jgi:hypothetical protein
MTSSGDHASNVSCASGFALCKRLALCNRDSGLTVRYIHVR